MTDPVYRGRYTGKRYKRKVKPLGMPDPLGRMKFKQVRTTEVAGNLLTESKMKDPLADLVKSQMAEAAEEDAAISEYLQKVSMRSAIGSGWDAAKRSAAAKKGWMTRKRGGGSGTRPNQLVYKPGKKMRNADPTKFKPITRVNMKQFGPLDSKGFYAQQSRGDAASRIAERQRESARRIEERKNRLAGQAKAKSMFPDS